MFSTYSDCTDDGAEGDKEQIISQCHPDKCQLVQDYHLDRVLMGSVFRGGLHPTGACQHVTFTVVKFER